MSPSKKDDEKMKDRHEAAVEQKTKKDNYTPPVRANEYEIVKAVKRALKETGK